MPLQQAQDFLGDEWNSGDDLLLSKKKFFSHFSIRRMSRQPQSFPATDTYHGWNVWCSGPSFFSFWTSLHLNISCRWAASTWTSCGCLASTSTSRLVRLGWPYAYNQQHCMRMPILYRSLVQIAIQHSRTRYYKHCVTPLCYATVLRQEGE